MTIVLNSQIKLNRNLKGYKFPSMIDENEKDEIISEVRNAVTPLGYQEINIEGLSSIMKLKYFEEGIFTGDLLKNIKIATVFVKENSPNILVNEDNHIVIQQRKDHLELMELLDEVMDVDDELDGNLIYAFDDKFGYLTSDINQCGIAMTPSVVMHLPALSYFGSERIFKNLNRLGYKIRGINGEDNKFSGKIYVISPQNSIGLSERECVQKLNNIAAELMSIELEKRQKLYIENFIELEDIVKRSYGILRNAHILNEDEMMDNFSNIFLGMELSVLKAKKEIELWPTIKLLKNGHIQIERGSLLDRKSRDILRANNTRSLMKEVF